MNATQPKPIAFGEITYRIEAFRFFSDWDDAAIDTAIVKLVIGDLACQVRIEKNEVWKFSSHCESKIRNILAQQWPSFDALDIRVYRKEIEYTVIFAADKLAKNQTCWLVTRNEPTSKPMDFEEWIYDTQPGVA